MAKGGQPKLSALYPAFLGGSQSILMNTRQKPEGLYYLLKK